MSSQPTLDQAYTTSGNPAETEPAEKKQQQQTDSANAQSGEVDQRIPQTQSSSQSDATPSSLGQGIHGAPPGEEAKGRTDEDVGRSTELDAAQMGAPGEGKVASAVDKKPGATGSEQGMETDLDRKKAEQAPQRKKEEERAQDKVNVGAVLGQSGGPASSVD